jgi:hypothetical protein
VPDELGTCCASLMPMDSPDVVVAIAAIVAPLMKVRRWIIVSSLNMLE